LDRLALALGVSLELLLHLTSQSNKFFFETKKIIKPDGSQRVTYDTKIELKAIHGKICEAFFKRIDYPEYLQGSIKRRDYLTDARIHVSSKVMFSEDVTNFFPSISKKVVHEMWVGVFGFSNPVANCLAELVTLDGFVVQGSKTSSYVCNLVLWNREAKLVETLKTKGFRYTRYVDDITVSSKRLVGTKEKSEIINSIYSMFRSINVRPNRKKHKIMPRNKQQSVHGVNVNKVKPSLPKLKRDKIRAAVHECELAFPNIARTPKYLKAFDSVTGRVATLGRMHKVEAKRLKNRLAAVKPIIVA
jgi:hypothetical protein